MTVTALDIRSPTAIAAALAEAEARGLRGAPITPFLLDAVRRATAGRSLDANRSLILANAGLAAEIALRLAALGSSRGGG